jgi:hypothetical protein
VIPPASAVYSSLAVSPDGNYLYFRKAEDALLTTYYLYRGPVLGGTPQIVYEISIVTSASLPTAAGFEASPECAQGLRGLGITSGTPNDPPEPLRYQFSGMSFRSRAERYMLRESKRLSCSLNLGTFLSLLGPRTLAISRRHYCSLMNRAPDRPKRSCC